MDKIKNSSTIKGLQSQLSKLQGARDNLRLEVERIQRELSSNRKSIDAIEKKIKDLTDSNKDIQVSEHALLRYCERVLGINTEAIKAEIINDVRLKELVNTLGDNGTYPVRDFQVIMRNKTITTIIK